MRETTKKLLLDVCYSVSLIENQGYQQNSSVAQDGDLSVCIWQISDQDCFWNFRFLKAGFAGDRIGIQVIVRTVRGFSLNHKHQSHKWNWKKMKLPCFFWFWFCSFYNSAYNCDFQFLLHHIIFFQFHLSLTPMIQGKLHHGSYKQKQTDIQSKFQFSILPKTVFYSPLQQSSFHLTVGNKVVP